MQIYLPHRRAQFRGGGGSVDFGLLQEDGSSFILQEDASSKIQTEDAT